MRISEEDMEFHRKVVEQVKEAQAVSRAWATHLHAKYGLGPGQAVDETGAVVGPSTV